MAVAQPLENVFAPRYLFVDGLETTRPNPQSPQDENTFPVRMEVYTGWVRVGSVFQPFAHQTVRTFLPVEDLALRVYQRESLIDFTATAAPAVVQPREAEEATLFGVDLVVRVALEPQSQLAGDPLCLVMRVQHSGQNVNFHSLTYQVTCLVTAEQGQVGEIIEDLNPDVAPI